MSRDSESLPSPDANENSPEAKPKRKAFVRVSPSRKSAAPKNNAEAKAEGRKSGGGNRTGSPESGMSVIEPEILDDRSARVGRTGSERPVRGEVIDVDDVTNVDSEDEPEGGWNPDNPDNLPMPLTRETEVEFEHEDFDADAYDDKAIGKEKGLVVTNALQRYLSELRKYPLLTLEEERATAMRAYEHNDIQARNRLVTANLRLVVKIAMEYRRAYSQILDLIQEGNAGLVQAVNRFNPYRGVKLSTYSAWWIRAYILKFLMDNKSLVRMGTTDAQRKLFFRLRSEAEKMYALTQRFDANLLAENIGVKESDVVEMQQRLTKNDVSLDAPVGADGETRQIDMLSANIEEADVVLEREELITLLRREVGEVEKELNDRDKYIFQNRILADEPITLQDVGDKFGITRERARQLEARVMKKIKDRLIAAGISK